MSEVKLLHTADLHLTEAHPERWSALEQLVAVARQENVTALVISGDLFDHSIDAEKMRDHLRSVLRETGFLTIILPGNHDYKAYRSGLYYGNQVRVIDDWQEPVHHKGAVFWGLPYTILSRERLAGLLIELGKKMDPGAFNILLYHGELLDAFFTRRDLGDETELRYMPVKLSYFSHLPVAYILGGHFHSRAASWLLPGGGLFLYSGSPVAITKRETGIRTVNLLSNQAEPREIVLATEHYEEVKIQLDPYLNQNPLTEFKASLTKLHPAAKILLKIEGLYDGSALGLTELELVEAIRELGGDRLAAEPIEDFFDVRHILEDDLYKRFREKLEQADCDSEQSAQINEMVIKAFREVKLCT